jgi:hypothetical protein
MPYYAQRENSDFDYYYQAAHGNLDHLGGKHMVPYIYHPVTQYLFTPLSWFSYYHALGVICWLALAWKLMSVKWGMWVVLFSFYPYWLNLMAGNVNTVLAFLGVHQTTGVLAAVFKPYYTLHSTLAHWKEFKTLRHSIIWAAGLTVVCIILYLTNQNLRDFAPHFTEEFTRKMNLIHLLPLYYIWRKK